MSGTLLRGLLLAGSAAAVGLSAVALAVPPLAVRLPGPPGNALTTPALEIAVPDSLVRQVIGRTPFRASRSRAGVPYSPDRSMVEVVETEPVPKPRLALTGIVWEPEPVAIIEGMPDTEGGRVLRRGESVGGLKVKRIERDRVVITGLDTTWNLLVKEPWQ